MNAPTLLAQSDLYRSVNPILSAADGDDPNIKIARATTPDGKDPGQSGNDQSTNAPVTPAGSAAPEKEVRRAEAVRPMDLPAGAPVMTIPVPKPAEF